MRARSGVVGGSLAGHSGVVEGSNGIWFFGKAFVLFKKMGSFRHFFAICSDESAVLEELHDP